MKKTLKLVLMFISVGTLLTIGCALPDMVAFDEIGLSVDGDGAQAVPAAEDADTIALGGGGDLEGPVLIPKAATFFTLSWVPPEGSVTAYRIYYSAHGTDEWTLLDEVEAVAAPSYEIESGQIPAGEYDFAVTSVDAAGAESEKHSSLEPTEGFPNGWYVDWDPQ